MTEQQIQSNIIKYLEKDLGCYVVKIIKASKSGVPDLICCFKGDFIGIEVKRPSTINNASELQRVNLELINNAGGIGFVACSVQDVKDRLGF